MLHFKKFTESSNFKKSLLNDVQDLILDMKDEFPEMNKHPAKNKSEIIYRVIDNIAYIKTQKDCARILIRFWLPRDISKKSICDRIIEYSEKVLVPRLKKMGYEISIKKNDITGRHWASVWNKDIFDIYVTLPID